MGGLKVMMIDIDGVGHAIDGVEEGANLMELGRRNDVAGILGDCGGGCACATCHVYVDPLWLARVGGPGEIEQAMLEMVDDVRRPNSRLGCQIRMTPELDGLNVTVAPSSMY